MTYQIANPIKIYVSEEQEFYRYIYESSFTPDNSFQMVGTSVNEEEKALWQALESENPNILIVGFKKFDENRLKELEHVCTAHPKIGLVLLMTSVSDIEAKLLRKMLGKCSGGVAIYLKQSVDNVKQLHDMVQSVHRKQIVLDPLVANLILMERAEYPFMKQLTERELEILNLLAQGCTNQAIAQDLCIDIKTVAHHLNNIYSKLKDDDESNLKHPRVSVARMYLETTGELMPCSGKRQLSLSMAG